ADSRGIGARGVKEGPAGAAPAIDLFFGEMLKVVAVVVIFFTNHVHKAGPAPPKADHLIAFADGPDRDCPDGRVQARHITTSSQDSDDALLGVHISHKIAFRMIAPQDRKSTRLNSSH